MKIACASGVFQVQRHAALVAVQVLEVEAVAVAAGSVAFGLARRLDLDHVGAPIGELPHRGRAGAMGRQVQHLKTMQRQIGHDGTPYGTGRQCPILEQPGSAA